MKKQLLIAATLMLLLISCGNDEILEGGYIPPDKYPLGLTVELSRGFSRATVNGTWENSDRIAVQAITSDNLATDWNNANAHLYMMSNDNPVPVDAKKAHYWQASDEKKIVRAWHCSDGTTSETIPSQWSVQSIQVGLKKYQINDLLFAAPVMVNFANSANLTFYHQTAKVIVRIKESETIENHGYITSLTIGNDNIALKGTYKPPTDVNTNYGSWTPIQNSCASIIPNIMNDVPKGYVVACEALVIPQDMSGKQLIAITTLHAGTLYYTPRSGEAAFKPGCVYTYDITINGSTLSVNVNEILWNTDGTTGTVNATMPKEIDISDGKSVEINGDSPYLITGTGSKTITINGNSTVIFKDVNIKGAPAVNIIGGNPKLKFIGTSYFTVGNDSEAISLSNGANVTMTGSGTVNLKKTSDGYAAVFGAAKGAKCGNITITDVTLNIDVSGNTDNYRSTGIGSGNNSTCGDIIITDAKVKIVRCGGAAAIGTGIAIEGPSICGDIRITNSDIDITSGNWYGYEGPAIGCGDGDSYGAGTPAIYDNIVNGIYITLKSGQSKNRFLENLRVYGNADKVGQGCHKKYSTITNGIHWYNANGSVIP